MITFLRHRANALPCVRTQQAWLRREVILVSWRETDHAIGIEKGDLSFKSLLQVPCRDDDVNSHVAGVPPAKGQAKARRVKRKRMEPWSCLARGCYRMMHERNGEALYVRKFLRCVYVILVSRVDIFESRILTWAMITSIEIRSCYVFLYVTLPTRIVSNRMK